MFFLYAVVIILAGALFWSELNRRKSKDTLLGSVKTNDYQGEVIEVRREVDPSTQSVDQIISESFDIEKELLQIAEQKKKYNEGINTGIVTSSGVENSTSINKTELNLDKYVDAF